jgi:uncharacterized membrane protein
MLNPQREDIQIICKHSNWSKNEVSKTLKTAIYNDAPAWRKFLQLLLITLGIAFTVAGIVFFFAYNWENLGKVGKFAIVEGCIVAITVAVLFSRLALIVKKILLTGAAIIVGAMFAVFGQVYYTGANTCDFFLAWTVFISLWAIVSNFPPLWLVYVALINTTICFYAQQVAPWSRDFTFLLLLLVNVACFLFFMLISTFGSITVPRWFRNVLGLWTAGIATIGVNGAILDKHLDVTAISIYVFTAVAYIAGALYGFRQKSGFFLGSISFSVILMIASLLVRILPSVEMMSFVSLFVVLSVTLVIAQLINLQKSIRHEK